jgi:hypothetical protein
MLPSTVPLELSTAHASMEDGKNLPTWLNFEPASMRFTATNAPEGGLPVTVNVTIMDIEGNTHSIRVVVQKTN